MQGSGLGWCLSLAEGEPGTRFLHAQRRDSGFLEAGRSLLFHSYTAMPCAEIFQKSSFPAFEIASEPQGTEMSRPGNAAGRAR